MRGGREDVGKILVKQRVEALFHGGRKHGPNVEAPLAVVIADLDEQPVLSRLQFQDGLTLVRLGGPMHILSKERLAIEPYRERIVAAERDGKHGRFLHFNLMEEVYAGIGVFA